ncbi:MULTISPECIES: type 1 glutamine amidotransferase domain-containing protein [unclassified Nocardiopsis]|uniref:type 1 glutamine amidotransferase domain-containing protein n=1 Tax=unclassified Nocardiopsis TaxID=2649073 RepID=UPI00135C9046|nr:MULTISPECIES: type 1 glutamine amidotransferase domain-containing protein [unclassified Nocardiopsis]
MADTLSGRRVAILAADGVEQVELVKPREALREEGADVDLVSLKSGQIQAMNGDINQADRFTVDRVVSEAGAGDYDALVVPGGTVNPDNLRQDQNAVGFVRDFVESGKPVAAICHGPWILVEADVVRGRTVTSYPSVRTDLRNAGATVVEEEVVTDQGVTTSRNPDDLPAFCERIVREFAAR